MTEDGPTWGEAGGLVVVGGVVVAAVASLVGAWLGVHDGRVVAAVALVAVVVGAVGLVRRRRPRFDGAELVVLAVLLAVATALFVPGFPYAANHRDPGVYVNHAVAMARDGDLNIEDPIFDTEARFTGRNGVPLQLETDEGPVSWRSGGFLGFARDPDDPTRLRPRFFHLWPALLATAHDLGGPVAVANVGPVLGVLAVGLVTLAGRRAFRKPPLGDGPAARRWEPGLWAGAAAGLVLATNLLQVWQAKYPSSEILTQFLVVGALAALALAVTTGSRGAALVAGVATGSTFLVRADGIYLVALALIGCAGLWALRRAGPVVGWLLVGLGAAAALGLYQAYGPAARYSAIQQGFPSGGVVAAGLVVVVVAALGVRLAPTSWTGWLARPETVRRLLLAATALLTVLLVVLWFRPQWQGVTERINKAGDLVRAYDELNLRRLAWFLSVPGLLLAGVGLWVAALHRGLGRVILVPGLLFLPVLLWEPRIAPFLMWWGRRYTPVILPTLVLLIGLAVAWVVSRHRSVGPVVAVVVVGLVVGLNLADVRPMRSVRDFGGSRSLVDQLDRNAGEDAVLVWQTGTALRNDYAITGLTWHGLPTIDPGEELTPELLADLQAAVPDRELHVVAGSPLRPETRRVLDLVEEVQHGIERWPDTFEELPSEGKIQPLTVSVWRYAGAGPAGGAAAGPAAVAPPG